MLDLRGRGKSNGSAGKPEPQAEIEVLPVHEVALVEAAEPFPLALSYDERGSGAERDLDWGLRGSGYRLTAAPGPAHAEVVDDVPCRIDQLAVIHRDQCLPGTPVG